MTSVTRSIDPSLLSADIASAQEEVADLMEDDIGVDDQPVTLLGIELGVLQESLARQDWSKARELAAEETLFEATGYIVTNISLSQD